MMRISEGLPASVLAVLLGVGGTVQADTLPLPPDVRRSELDGPFDLVVGAQPTRVETYSTRLSLEGVRAFYERALPEAGWTFTPLPGMAQAEHGMQALEEGMRRDPEKASHPYVQQQLPLLRQQMTAMRQQMRNAVYAVRGAERLLLIFDPFGGETVVVAHRWEEGPGSPALFGEAWQPAPHVGASDAGSSPSTPCCNGSPSMPEALRTLPSWIPRYPNGQMIIAGAASGVGMGEGAPPTTETYMTDDSLEQALAYYREHMVYNGWTPVDVPASATDQLEQYLGPMAHHIVPGLLVFRNDRAICSVTVTQARGLAQSAAALAHMPPELRAALGPGQAPVEVGSFEKTFVTVDYLELGPEVLGPGGSGELFPASPRR